MFPFLAFIFLLVPLVEIYVLIQVGQVIGAGWTILLVVLTAVIGVWLLRLQGLSTLMRGRVSARMIVANSVHVHRPDAREQDVIDGVKYRRDD